MATRRPPEHDRPLSYKETVAMRKKFLAWKSRAKGECPQKRFGSLHRNVNKPKTKGDPK